MEGCVQNRLRTEQVTDVCGSEESESKHLACESLDFHVLDFSSDSTQPTAIDFGKMMIPDCRSTQMGILL